MKTDNTNWKVSSFGKVRDEKHNEICQMRLMEGDTWSGINGTSKWYDNAKLIVSAVNNHAALIDVLNSLDSAAICFADEYAIANQNKIEQMLAELHNAHLKAKQLLQKIESEKQ